MVKLPSQKKKHKGEGKGHPITGHKGPEKEERYCFTFPLALALDRVGWSMPRPGRFTSGKDPVTTGSYRGGTVVKVLCYKSESHLFDPSWWNWNFSLI